MTQTQATFPNGVLGVARALVAFVLAIAIIGLVFMLAAFLTMAAFVVAGVALIGAAGYWLYMKVRGKRPAKSGPTVLVAKQGPEGWTVDGKD